MFPIPPLCYTADNSPITKSTGNGLSNKMSMFSALWCLLLEFYSPLFYFLQTKKKDIFYFYFFGVAPAEVTETAVSKICFKIPCFW